MEDFLNVHLKVPMILLKLSRSMCLTCYASPGQQNCVMQTFFSWQLLVGLFVTSAYSLQDWVTGTQTSDMASSQPLLSIEIPDTPRLALATTDGSSEFAQPPPSGVDLVNPDEILVQGGSGCTSDTRTHSRRIRAKHEKMCPTNLPRPNGEEEQGRTLLHVSPNAQEDGGGQNTGGNDDPRPGVIIPPEDSKLPHLFIPEVNRPKKNPELCPEALYPVPVCGRPGDTYISSYPYPIQLTVDPCYICMWYFFLYNPSQHDDGVLMLKENFLREDVVPIGCISMEGGRIGYCCRSVEVAYGYVCAFLP